MNSDYRSFIIPHFLLFAESREKQKNVFLRSEAGETLKTWIVCSSAKSWRYGFRHALSTHVTCLPSSDVIIEIFYPTFGIGSLPLPIQNNPGTTDSKHPRVLNIPASLRREESDLILARLSCSLSPTLVKVKITSEFAQTSNCSNISL